MPKEDRITSGQMRSVLNDMVYTLINVQRPGFNHENDEKFRDRCSYPFIPQTHTRLMYTFHSLKQRLREIKGWTGHRRGFDKISFLDAGCGIGNVMMLAKSMDLAAKYHGIEYFEETFRRAENWLGIPWRNQQTFKLFKEDILKFNKYGQYDIIYYYCPFSDGELQRKFEERLEDEMKVGAILIAFLKQSGAVRKDYRFKRIEGIDACENVFIKVKKGPRKESNIASDEGIVAHAGSLERRRIYIEKYNMGQK